MKLRRFGAGAYETLDGRYRIEREDGLTECEHPQCDPLHQKFWTHTGDGRGAVHWVQYPAWHIWDNQKDDYVDPNESREFDRKCDAVAWLEGYLASKEVLEPKLVLERRPVQDKTVVIGPAMLSPEPDENYWDYRVKLSDKQAIIGFKKFDTIGVGFAVEGEMGWNTNLPVAIAAHEIFAHIARNKGDDSITDGECIAAIKLVQQAVREDMGNLWMDERVKRHAEARAGRAKR